MSTVEEIDDGFKPSVPQGSQKPPEGERDWAEIVFQLCITGAYTVPLLALVRGNWTLATHCIVGYVTLVCFLRALVRLVTAATKKLA